MEDKQKKRDKLSWLFSKRKDEPNPSAEEPPTVQAEPSPPVPPELPEGHPVRCLLERLGYGEVSMPALPEAGELERLQFEKRLVELAQTRAEHLEDAKRDSLPADFGAEYLVQMSKDRMCAWAMVFPPEGEGAPPSQEGLLQELARNQVSFGVEEDALQACLAEPWLRPRVAARGRPAEDGADGRVVELVPRQPEGLRADDPGSPIDYRSKSCVISIRAGDVLCDMIPPEPGKNGSRVDGTEIAAVPGKPARPPMGLNTQLTEDGAHLVATMDGHVLYSGSTFQVKPLLDIEGDVDYSTGNVEFRGDVHIGGDVRVNFRVKATGTVTIDGLVEAATVEADGDVIIARGVLGERKAVIRAGRTVRARYLENCAVYAGESVYSDCIINCQTCCDGKIYVRSGRGAIVGGRLAAAELVEAVSIGTQSERKTEIVLGVMPFNVEELRRCEDELAATRAEQSELERGSAASAGNEAKSRLRKTVLAVKEDRLLKRRAELKGKQVKLSQCRMTGGTVYPGVELTIAVDRFTFTSEYRRCTARYDEREAQIKIS